MPTLDGISVSLQSQYDALTIPEFVKQGSRYHSVDPSNSTAWTASSTSPFSRISTLEVNIPALPSSQFWISYFCLPPSPEGSQEANEVRFFYFKLFTSGKCVLSWGVGEREQWQGKLMFGLFEAGTTDFEGKRDVEKKGLFFPKKLEAKDVGVSFEIKVFRAKARKCDSLRYDTHKDGVKG